MNKGFLDAFGGRHVFCVIDDKRKNKSVLHFHEGYDLTQEEILQELTEANKANWGIFFCVNEIDRELDPGHKRTQKMLTRIRAVWADDDTVRDQPRDDWPLEPNIVVQSSPGKFHYYWLTTTNNLEQWAQVMAGIANTYETDANARDLVRVLRVPGFNHCKKKPIPVTAEINFEIPYLWEEVVTHFPPDTNVKASGPRGTTGTAQTFESKEAATQAIVDGSNYHGAIMWLLNHWVNKGVKDESELESLVIGVLAKSNRQDERWEARNKRDYLHQNIQDALRFVDENPLTDPVSIPNEIQSEECQVDLAFPPGAMGRLCQDILEMAPHPNEEVALMAGFALVSGIVGRRYNVSGDGLNLYMALLADSGVGKATLKNAINMALMKKCTLEGGGRFIGPSRFTGPKAVFNTLSTGLSRVCILEEAGLLQESRAGDQAGLTRVFLDLYTSSGRGHYAGGEHYSKSEDTVEVIHAPALTLAHVSTPDAYIRALREKNAARTGGIARVWMIRSTRPKSYINESRRVDYSPETTKRLKELVKECAPYQDKGKDDCVGIGLNGVKYKLDSDIWVDIENTHKRAGEELERTVASRAFMKTLKIASVISVFNGSPEILDDAYEWAKDAIAQEVKNIAAVMQYDAVDTVPDVVRSIIAPVIIKIVNDQYDDKLKSPPRGLKGQGIFTLSNLKQALKRNRAIGELDDDPSRASNPKSGFQKIIDHMLRDGMIQKVSESKLRACKAKTKFAYHITEDFRDSY